MDSEPYFTVAPDAVLLLCKAEVAVYIAVVVLLLVLSAVISVVKQANNSSLSVFLFRRTISLMKKSEKLTATMQVAHVFVNVAFVIIASYVGFLFLSNSLPKGIIAVIMSAVIIVLLFVANFVPRKKHSISIDDLSDALEKTTETSENENILKGIVKFGNIDVHTIMTPRMDVVSVDVTTKLPELIAKINEWGYSRKPVYEETPDNVKGILYVKDLLPYIDETEDFQWQNLIRNAYFVPEHKKIDDLLKEFQEMKIHMAVIIDEYGGMAGIVTLEDILEEIVGDIADESDDDEQDYIKIDDCTYLFDGKVLLNDFFRIMRLNEMDFDSVKGEADTLAGVILEMKGEIPQKGDYTEYMGLSFYVESVDNRRIKQIKVIINEK